MFIFRTISLVLLAIIMWYLHSHSLYFYALAALILISLLVLSLVLSIVKRKEIEGFQDKIISFNFRLLLPLLAGICAVLFASWLDQALLFKGERSGFSDWIIKRYTDVKSIYNATEGENFLSVLSTLYAIFIAMLAVNLMNKFSSLRRVISEEANTIETINSGLFFFEGHDTVHPKDQKKLEKNKKIVQKIRGALGEYIENVKKTEGKKGITDSANRRVIIRLREDIACLECLDHNDQVALEQIMISLIALVNLRSDRLSRIGNTFSVYLYIAIILMSVGIVTPFYLTPDSVTHTLQSNSFIIFSLVSAFVFLFNMLLDFSFPHYGVWQIDIAKEYADIDLQPSHISDHKVELLEGSGQE